MRSRIVLAMALIMPGAGTGCCVSRPELAADVKAWEGFTNAVEPDLRFMYEGMGEPSRTTRLRLLEDNRAAIAAATSRTKN